MQLYERKTLTTVDCRTDARHAYSEKDGPNCLRREPSRCLRSLAG